MSEGSVMWSVILVPKGSTAPPDFTYKDSNQEQQQREDPEPHPVPGRPQTYRFLDLQSGQLIATNDKTSKPIVATVAQITNTKR